MSSKRTRKLRADKIRKRVQGLTHEERKEAILAAVERIGKSPLQSTATIPDASAPCTCNRVMPRCWYCYPPSDNERYNRHIRGMHTQEEREAMFPSEWVGNSNLGPVERAIRFNELYGGGTRTGRWTSRGVSTAHPETQTLNYAMEGLRQSFADILEPLRGFAQTINDAITNGLGFHSGGFVPRTETDPLWNADLSEVETRVLGNTANYVIGIDYGQEETEHPNAAQLREEITARISREMNEELENSILYGSTQTSSQHQESDDTITASQLAESARRMGAVAASSGATTEDLAAALQRYMSQPPRLAVLEPRTSPYFEEHYIGNFDPPEEEPMSFVDTISDHAAEILGRALLQRFQRTDNRDETFRFMVDRRIDRMSYMAHVSMEFSESDLYDVARDLGNANDSSNIPLLLEQIIMGYQTSQLRDRELLVMLVRYIKDQEQWRTLQKDNPDLFAALEARISQGHDVILSQGVQDTMQRATRSDDESTIQTKRRRLTLRKRKSEAEPDGGECESAPSDDRDT